MYCKQHAKYGMVNVRCQRCSYSSCTTQPSFNVEGTKAAVYCKQHAKGGMVNVHYKCCSYDSCTTRSRYNFEGNSTAKYCKQHAEDGMVDICRKRCIFGGCQKSPSFNIKGGRSRLYCKRHAEDGMVNLRMDHRWNKSIPKPPPKLVLSNVVDSSSIGQYRDISDGGPISGQTRPRLALNSKKVICRTDEGPLVHGKVVQCVGTSPSQSGVLASLSGTVGRHGYDTMIETVVAGGGQKKTVICRPVAGDEPSLATKPIKVELEMNIKL